MELIARGRAADVFDAGSGRVLRRYRIAGADATREAEAMAYVASHGYPVPEVVSADRGDLLLERVDGPTMLADLSSRPWRVADHARTLADLHTRLGAIPPLPGMPAPMGPGDGMLHLDLHPDNVILGPRGPVVIDWTNVSAGPPAADVADTWLLVACARPETGRLVASVGAGLLTRLFLRHTDRRAAVAQLHAAFLHRVADHNMAPPEVARMRTLVTRETGTAPS